LYYPAQLSLYPGETEKFNVTLQNHASIDYSITLDFHLDNVTYQDSYISFSNAIYTIFFGTQNITAELSAKSTAPPTNASLTVGIERIGEVVFIDEFEGSVLKSEWNITDPYGGSIFSLTSMPNHITIATTSPPDRDLWQGVNLYSPRIMLPIYGNFTIETSLLATFNTSVQSAGIVMWQDENNYLRLERAFRYDYHEVIFNGMINGVYSTVAPEVVNPGALLHIPNINPTYLRLVRKGMTYSGYYSTDGLNWNLLANITIDTDYALSVGLYNVIRWAPRLSVSFDYFKVSVGE
jgi:hypothetical protein